nr:MAG TPA: hypothetical protein [Caudoviricetes sp.]
MSGNEFLSDRKFLHVFFDSHDPLCPGDHDFAGGNDILMQFDVDVIFAQSTDMLVHADALMFDLDTFGGVGFADHAFGNGTEQVIVIGSLHRDFDRHFGDFRSQSLSGFEIRFAFGFDFFLLSFELTQSDGRSRSGQTAGDQVVSSKARRNMNGITGQTKILHVLQQDQIHSSSHDSCLSLEVREQC